MMNTKKILALSIFCLLIFSFHSAFAGPGSAEKSQNKSHYIAQTKKIIKLLANKQFGAVFSDFTPAEKKVLTVKGLNEGWKLMTSGSGRFLKVSHILITKEIFFKKFQYTLAAATCQFSNSSVGIHIAFNQLGKISSLHFLPILSYTPPSAAYANPKLFHEKKIILGKREYRVHGTLTLPDGSGPFPAVVLLSGSGPMDQNETMGPNQPFKDLAWGLASAGIAVLRYDKPTEENPADFSPLSANFTVKQEYMIDAEAALSFLKTVKQINPKQIFLLGHSEGGMVIPRIAKTDPQIAGLIFMAAPIHMLRLIVSQESYLISITPFKTKMAKDLALVQVKTLKNEIKDLNSGDPGVIPSEILGAPAGYWLDLRHHNPAEIAAALKQPLLLLQGGRDHQVPVSEFNLWKKDLKPKKNVNFKFYPNLNHLFMKVAGRMALSDYYHAGHVSIKVIRKIAKWIKKH
jgi:dienelactone hydrolase